MQKGIFAKDVRARDIVLLSGNQRIEIVSAGMNEQYGCFVLNGHNGLFSLVGSEEIVALIHRPWPEGKTERDMRIIVEIAAHHFLDHMTSHTRLETNPDAECLRRMAVLREAIETYELGKPFDFAQGKPDPLGQPPDHDGLDVLAGSR